MSNLKVAIYTQTFPPKTGGVSTSHFNIYNLLKDSYTIKVFAFNEKESITSDTIVKRSNIKWLSNILFKVVQIKYKSKSKKSKLACVKFIIDSFIPVLRLNKPLKQFNPDIIIVPDFNIPSYLIFKPKKTKLIWMARHNYFRFRDNILLEGLDFLDTDIASSMERNAMRKVDAVISPSQYMITSYKDALYANKPIFCVPNFMEQKVFDVIKEKSTKISVFPKNKKVIYIPSAGSIVKGKRYVFEIIRRLSSTNNDIYFYLSGTIPEDLKLELLPFKNQIYAPGHINWDDNFINVMQCYMGITPNLEENFSNAILEAQTSGVPFVAFDTGGNKEIIIDEETGFIVPYLDMEALLNKITILLKDTQLQKSFGDNSNSLCAKRFNNKRIKEEYKKVFEQITGK